jgi:thiamine biosynthesis protein ThiS
MDTGRRTEVPVDGEIRVVVNGDARSCPSGTTVDAFLRSLDLVPGTVVVERNQSIVDRSAYGETVLEAGDRLELVHFVGGG